MNYFLAIGILVGAVSYGSADETTTTPPCSVDKMLAAVANCLDTYGMSEEYIKFQMNLTTAEDLKAACSHPEKYQQGLQCVKNATALCPSDFATSSYDQSIQDSLALCGDPKISFQCVAEYTRNKTGVTACVNSHWALTDISSRSNQELACYGRKVSIECAGELLRPCDAYTATTVETRMKLSTPVLCYFYPDVVG